MPTPWWDPYAAGPSRKELRDGLQPAPSRVSSQCGRPGAGDHDRRGARGGEAPEIVVEQPGRRQVRQRMLPAATAQARAPPGPSSTAISNGTLWTGNGISAPWKYAVSARSTFPAP